MQLEWLNAQKKNNYIRGLQKTETKKFFSRNAAADTNKNEVKKIIAVQDMLRHKIIQKVGDNMLTYAEMRNSDLIYFNKLQYIFKTKLFT